MPFLEDEERTAEAFNPDRDELVADHVLKVGQQTFVPGDVFPAELVEDAVVRRLIRVKHVRVRFGAKTTPQVEKPKPTVARKAATKARSKR